MRMVPFEKTSVGKSIPESKLSKEVTVAHSLKPIAAASSKSIAKFSLQRRSLPLLSEMKIYPRLLWRRLSASGNDVYSGIGLSRE
jgi:hypothetical protein